MVPRSALIYALALAGVLAAYVAAGKLGLALASLHASASAVWPPTGIAIAACVVLGRRMWPAVYAGAFVVNVTTSGDALSSLGIALGNTLEAVVAATLLARFANGRDAFLRVGTVLRFVGAALLATMVSASLGVGTLELTGLAPAADAGAIWWTWWLGDLGGAFVVAPVLVLWASAVPRLHGVGSGFELAALGVATAVIALVVFSPYSSLARENYPVGFLVFPVLGWAAVRFGPRVASTTAAALAAVAVWGTLQGTGPWVRASENASLVLSQSFMGVAALTSLFIAAAVIERQQALEALRRTEERLRVAEERKVAARDEFLSIAAHELKTPLTSLQLATQYLLRELDAGHAISAEALRTAASALSSQTARLVALVGQLLDTVRVQAGRMELDVSEHDVAALARRVASEAQATTTRHDIEVHGPPVLLTPVDPMRLEQVLRNLLDNAIKFSPGGKVAVDLSNGEGASVQVSVRDHGPGIPPAARERIFDRFFQAREDDHRDGGLGLGLHVSRSIVELHGGSIAADFPADGGTRIIVRLPK